MMSMIEGSAGPDIEPKTPSPDRVRDSGTTGLFQRIIDIFARAGDPEREKKRLLKDIAKTLKKQKFKFYKPKSHEALSGLAQFFYTIYKFVGPAQVLLEHAESSGALKSIIIENFLEDRQKEQIELFDEESIRRQAETTDLKQVAARLKEELVTFFSSFDNERVKLINTTYNRLAVFLQLVNFDYYFLLKKFDSAIPERNFSYNPNFDSINGEYLSDDLKDFLSVLHLIDLNGDWDPVFEVCRLYKGQDVISKNEWKKVLKALAAVRKSNILVLMVKHLDEDPYFKVKIYPPKGQIVESYLTKMKNQVEMTVQKIILEKRNSKIDQLSRQVFGTTAVSRMKFYTEKANMTFSKKMLGGYIYVDPLNYLKAFLLDYVKKDVKEVVDNLLIKGQWSTNVMSQQLSESFHNLLVISDQLLKFDESLSEEGEVGVKTKTLISRSDRDPNSMSVLKQLLKETNEKAQKLAKGAAQNLIVVAKNIKLCIEDYEKSPHELIVNWKELEGALENKVKQKMTEVYKKIYFFIQLLQFYVK